MDENNNNHNSDTNNSDSDYPSVYLYHLDGGHIYRSNGCPTFKKEGKPSAFKILPLNDEGELIQQQQQQCSSSSASSSTTTTSASTSSTTITTRAQYIQTLMSWKKVAIQDENGCYLKCGKYLPHGGAQAWYGTNLTTPKQFELEYCSKTGTFSFKSYNGLYLHHNPYLGTVAFKTREAEEASWHIHPLGLVASDTEQILFVGVVNKEKEFLIQKTAEGIVPENWNVDLDIILTILLNELPFTMTDGSSSLFEHFFTHQQWCVTRSNEETLNIVISSNKYPKAFASECVEELEDIYEQYNDTEKDEQLNTYKINKDDHYSRLLTGLIYEYDDQYVCSVYAAANEKIRKTLEKMQENITNIQDNIATAEDMKEKTDELLEFANAFQKQSSELNNLMWRKRAIMSGVVIGGTSGALVGFFVGGPGAAAFLGVEAIEIAAGAATGILVGRTAVLSYTSRFWKRCFVRLGKTITLSR